MVVIVVVVVVAIFYPKEFSIICLLKLFFLIMTIDGTGWLKFVFENEIETKKKLNQNSEFGHKCCHCIIIIIIIICFVSYMCTDHTYTQVPKLILSLVKADRIHDKQASQPLSFVSLESFFRQYSIVFII